MDGEFFGSTLDFEYNIGDKLYDFAIMEYDEFDKLKILYTELINIVCSNKECNGMDKKVNFLFEMFHKVQECLNFSPYTHFYTQTLIDIIIKTYNSGVFRSDLLFKNNIGVYIDNTEYTPNEIFEEIQMAYCKEIYDSSLVMDKNKACLVEFNGKSCDFKIGKRLQKKEQLYVENF